RDSQSTGERLPLEWACARPNRLPVHRSTAPSARLVGRRRFDRLCRQPWSHALGPRDPRGQVAFRVESAAVRGTLRAGSTDDFATRTRPAERDQPAPPGSPPRRLRRGRRPQVPGPSVVAPEAAAHRVWSSVTAPPLMWLGPSRRDVRRAPRARRVALPGGGGRRLADALRLEPALGVDRGLAAVAGRGHSRPA